MMAYLNRQVRIRPNKVQREFLNRAFALRADVWNAALAEHQRVYAETGKGPTGFDLNMWLTRAVPEMRAWHVGDFPKRQLRSAIKDLSGSFSAFYAKLKKGTPFKQAGLPKTIGKNEGHRVNTVSFFDTPIRVDGDRLSVGRFLTGVKILGSHQLNDFTDAKQVRINQDRLGRYYTTICFEVAPDIEPQAIDPEIFKGVDLGCSEDNFAVLSDGTVYPKPRHFRQAEKLLARRQRQLSKCEKGSRRYVKAKRKVTKLHRSVMNQRKAFLHKLSSEIVANASGVAMEGHNFAKQVKGSRYAKSLLDAGQGIFREMIKEKCRRAGKAFKTTPEYFPSTQRCNACGHVHEGEDKLMIEDRVIYCKKCFKEEDRDLNSARNIRDEGLQLLGIELVTS